MATAARRTATYQDLLDLPEHLVGELLNGEMIVSPRPASAHARAASGLGVLVGGPFDFGRGGGPGGWWIVDEPELHLAGDVLIPDLAGWRRARLPAFPVVPFFTSAPDWICEVLSDSTRRIDRARKLPRYAAAGVAHAWLIDPLAQTLEVLRLTQGHYLAVATFEGAAAVEAEPFQAVVLDLGLLWVDR